KSNVVAPPLQGLEWGMSLDDVLEVLKAAEPDTGFVMGDGSYPILQLSPEQLTALGMEKLGELPFDPDDIHPVTLNFSDANTGTPVLVTASVRLDLSGAEDAQKTMDDALNKLYGEPVMGTSRGTAGLTLKKEDCGGIREDQLALLENHDYDAFYIYPMVTAGLSPVDEAVGELWYSGENYVDYMNGK
ncbi:MAG: hypothetical protein IKU17_03850, partial [Clostridia bacterium]|nr:hypothetical protein [Clostridia bacterium]